MQQNQINNNTAMICIDFDLIYVKSIPSGAHCAWSNTQAAEAMAEA